MNRVTALRGPFAVLVALLFSLAGTTSAATAAPPGTVWHNEPTVAQLSPTLRLTLTFATRVTDAAGNPKVGVPIHFTLLAPMPPFPEPVTGLPPIEICSARTDANGFATCSGRALVGSLLSIVAGGAYATEYLGFFPTESHTKLPVLTFR